MFVVRFADGVVVEAVGQDYVALTPSGEAVRITGSVATSLRRMLEDSMSLTSADRQLLGDTGLVEQVAGGVTRRGVVLGSVAVAGGGVFALLLPVAALASSQPAEIWGDYLAQTDFENETNVLVHYVSIYVYAGPIAYDNYREPGNLPADAAWPAGLNPTDSWVLLFGSASVPLEFNPSEDALRFQAEDPEDNWSQDLFDFLADDWVAGRTIELAISNGSVTVPVTLWAFNAPTA